MYETKTLRPRVAVSIGLEHPDPDRVLFKNKWLQYVEQGMVLHLAQCGGQPLLVPDLRDESLTVEGLRVAHGLLLTGGADIAPESYGDQPRHPDWAGDAMRDRYELALFRAARELGMPVLGICRGHQLINVGCGGSMYQDIETEFSAQGTGGAQPHRDQDLYDKLEHEVTIADGTFLASLLGVGPRIVNSVHHQAVRELGTGLTAAAVTSDGIVEAVEGKDGFCLGIQWHPEWQDGRSAAEPIFTAFIAACRQYSERVRVA